MQQLGHTLPLNTFISAPSVTGTEHTNNENHQSLVCVCEREREKERSGKARVPHLSCQTLPSLLTANSIKMKRTSWQHSNGLLHQSLSAVLWRSLREKYRNVWRNGSFSLSVSSSQSCAFSWFLELLWECGRSISLTFHHSPHLSLLLL